MRILLALLALLISAAPQAEVPVQPFVPESGFYWNAAQPGRGYAIEIQDRTLFITAYVYSEEPEVRQRVPLWYSAAGQVSEGRDSFGPVYRYAGELQYSAEGQCLGCPFVTPVTVPAGLPIDITFFSPVQASMVIAGEQIDLERFWFSPRFSIRDPIFALFGQWMIVTDFTDVDDGILPFDGDLLEIGFEGVAGGQSTAEGFRGGTAIPVSGAYNAADDFYVLVVAERPDEFLAYYFFGSDFGTNRIRGFTERYPPGSNITGFGFPMQAYRISDRTHAEQVLGAKDDTASRRAAPGEVGKSASAAELPRGLARTEGPRPTRGPRSRSKQTVEGAAAAPRVPIASLNAMVRALEARLASAGDR